MLAPVEAFGEFLLHRRTQLFGGSVKKRSSYSRVLIGVEGWQLELCGALVAQQDAVGEFGARAVSAGNVAVVAANRSWASSVSHAIERERRVVFPAALQAGALCACWQGGIGRSVHGGQSNI